ncbi:MAG: ABC transporter ATP-binding protein [Rhodobacterales bacterium]|nr:MAG: ABC transporter ATP-binding protein [Rhodobacterales bacterium]
MSGNKPIPATVTGEAANALVGATANANPAPEAEPQERPKRQRLRVVDSGAPIGKPRLLRRAELLSVYCGLVGENVPARDLHDAMHDAHAKDPRGSVSAATLAEGLKSAGLAVSVRRTSALKANDFPAIAMMTNGTAVLVLALEDGQVVLYERGAQGGRAEVSLSEFKSSFTGKLIKAEAALSTLDRRHATAAPKGHWFWSEITRYKRHFADVALGSFVANLLAVAVALFSLQVYDRVIPHQSTATLWVLAIGVMLAIMMEAGIKMARARLMDGAGKAIEINVQRLLMRRVLGMRSDKRPTSPSGLFATMREFGSVREFFTASSVGALTDIPFIFLFLALVYSIAGNVVWVLVAGGALMVLPGLLMQKRMVELSRQTQGANAKTSRILQEAIYELDTIKSAQGETRFLRLWDELGMLQAMKSSDQRRLASALTFWAQGVQQATYVGAVIMGTYLVFAGEFTVGSIIAVGILTGRTLSPLTQLAGTLARWSNVKNALEGLDAIVESDQDADEGRSHLRREEIKGAYELREVRFAYDDDAPSVDVPALAINPGQKVAVLGANGSGKSTFLKLLSGLYRARDGRVMLDGVDIGHIAPRDLRRSVGYLGQDVRLFAGTLRDNLNLTMLERDDERLLQALDFAGIGEFVRRHAKGLDLEIRDAGEGLSMGQRQSIGWARIWLQDPSVVLLDEPTSALDQTLETALISRLERWLEGRTAIIATHRLPILALTERTLILQQGRLLVDGPRDEVLNHLMDRQQVREAV